MIKINTCHILDEPLFVDGEESKDILEMGEVTGGVEMEPVSDIGYHLIATKTGQDLLVNGKASFQPLCPLSETGGNHCPDCPLVHLPRRCAGSGSGYYR